MSFFVIGMQYISNCGFLKNILDNPVVSREVNYLAMNKPIKAIVACWQGD
jgi:hypothetical protein